MARKINNLEDVQGLSAPFKIQRNVGIGGLQLFRQTGRCLADLNSHPSLKATSEVGNRAVTSYPANIPRGPGVAAHKHLATSFPCEEHGNPEF